MCNPCTLPSEYQVSELIADAFKISLNFHFSPISPLLALTGTDLSLAPEFNKRPGSSPWLTCNPPCNLWGACNQPARAPLGTQMAPLAVRGAKSETTVFLEDIRYFRYTVQQADSKYNRYFSS